MISVTIVTDGTSMGSHVFDADGKRLSVQRLSLTFDYTKTYASGKFTQIVEDEKGKIKWVDSHDGLIPETRVVYCDVIKIEHPDSRSGCLTLEEFERLYDPH